MRSTVLTFYLCGTLCGIDIRRSKELCRNVEYASVPGASKEIAGLMNLRGQIVTLFFLDKLLNFSERSLLEQKNCIILKNRSDDPDQFGFFIDKKGDVVELNDDMGMALPSNFRHIDSRFIESVARLNDEVLLVLDLDAIFEKPNL